MLKLELTPPKLGHLKLNSSVNSILHDLRIIFNFNMDSKNPAIAILAGQPPLVTQLNRQPHETKDYITSRLKLASVAEQIFTDDALELVHSSSIGLVRKINSIIRMTLLDGAKTKVKVHRFRVYLQSTKRAKNHILN